MKLLEAKVFSLKRSQDTAGMLPISFLATFSVYSLRLLVILHILPTDNLAADDSNIKCFMKYISTPPFALCFYRIKPGNLIMSLNFNFSDKAWWFNQELLFRLFQYYSLSRIFLDFRHWKLEHLSVVHCFLFSIATFLEALLWNVDAVLAWLTQTSTTRCKERHVTFFYCSPATPLTLSAQQGHSTIIEETNVTLHSTCSCGSCKPGFSRGPSHVKTCSMQLIFLQFFLNCNFLPSSRKPKTSKVKYSLHVTSHLYVGDNEIFFHLEASVADDKVTQLWLSWIGFIFSGNAALWIRAQVWNRKIVNSWFGFWAGQSIFMYLGKTRYAYIPP